MDVYGRESFGERRDSVVRVEVSRLRKRLRNYYADEGSHHALRIEIPAGTYQPEFTPRTAHSTIPPSPPKPKHARAAWVPASILLTVVLLVVLGWDRRPKATSFTPARTSQDPDRRPVGGIPHPIHILAGSSTERSVDRFGVEWTGDRYFIGGEQNHWQFGGKEMGVPVRTIRWAPDQLYFRSFRFGSFSYRIPLAEGKYDLKLYFSEVIFLPTDFGDGVENRRIFDVAMNGQPLLPSFDIAADAGGANTADIRAFSNVSPVNGFLTLDFRPILAGAWLNAIEIIPNNTGRPLPIRIVTRNANITDHAGRLWELDRYYNGGRQISDGEMASGTEDPDLFLWQRYGSFTYRFPVPPGKYTLRLLFAETFFGPNRPCGVYRAFQPSPRPTLCGVGVCRCHGSPYVLLNCSAAVHAGTLTNDLLDGGAVKTDRLAQFEAGEHWPVDTGGVREDPPRRYAQPIGHFLSREQPLGPSQSVRRRIGRGA